jgi:hypothetical protein
MALLYVTCAACDGILPRDKAGATCPDCGSDAPGWAPWEPRDLPRLGVDRLLDIVDILIDAMPQEDWLTETGMLRPVIADALRILAQHDVLYRDYFADNDD